MRRDDICLYVSPANRTQLNAIVADRNSPRKLVWRAEIVLATAEGLGTNAIMRRTGKSKPCVWRWQERYMEEGVDGLKRDKTRPSRKPPLSAQTKLAVIKKTTTEKPASATHWSAREMAKAVRLSHRSIQRIWAEAGECQIFCVRGFCEGGTVVGLCFSRTPPSNAWWLTRAGQLVLSRPSAAEGGGRRPAFTGPAVRPYSCHRA